MEVLEEAELETVAANFEEASPQEILRWAVERYSNRLTLGTGLGPSGVVLAHMLREITPRPNLFFLDTELLFKETYTLVRDLEAALDVKIEAVRPVHSVAGQTFLEGPNLWKHNPDRCCNLRKVEPLRNHLAGYDAWITGIRRDQGPTRVHTQIVHEVPAYGVVKINPLATWTREMVWTYINAHGLPTNALHEQGYSSIGCTHCTRPVATGAPERAGRWVGVNKTECGLHTA
jgi:phosphoadenosine phosphosulfate reductase